MCWYLLSGSHSSDGQTKGGRWDKSLGVLCQKFIMLFLIAPVSEFSTSSSSEGLRLLDSRNTAEPL